MEWDAEAIARAKELLRNPGPDIDRLGPCPHWCAGRPHRFKGDVAAEQSHVSQEMHPLRVDTVATERFGTRYRLLGAEVDWAPFAFSPSSRRIAGLVYIDGDCPVEMTPDQIRTLADNLIPQAERLREFADFLAGLRVEDMPDQGDPDKDGIPVDPETFERSYLEDD